MSITDCLSGVVAYIVSHSDGVVNDKAALTQRLASMGATVTGRFSGLVTHIIFRCKPHASKEERLAEGQSLFELYNRIDKATQQRRGIIQTFIVAPFWIEACFSNGSPAPENPYIVPRPEMFLHLPRIKTPGSSAGKKRKRYIQQPKPVQRYDLDIGAFEFSSTQQMHDDQPAHSAHLSGWEEAGLHAPSLREDCCPGSAGSMPAAPSASGEDLPAVRPLSAPSAMESASQPIPLAETDAPQQAALAPDLVTAERTPCEARQARAAAVHCGGAYAAQQQGLGGCAHGPLTGSLRQQQQWHRHVEPAEVRANSRSGGSPASLAGTYETGEQPPAHAGLWAGADVTHKQQPAADGHAHSAGADTTVSRSAPQQHQCTPVSRDREPRSHMHPADISTSESPLCTPGPVSGLTPLQHFTIPKLKAPSTALAGTPMLAGKQSEARDWAKAQGDNFGGRSAASKASTKGKLSDAPSSAPVVVDLCTPGAVTIPCLKPATAARLGRSPLAFPGFSPAAAQTPAFHSNWHAGSMSAVTELAPRHAEGRQQQECCTPQQLPSRPAGLVQMIAPSAVQTATQHAPGFGSPLLTQDTPQVAIRRGADCCPAGAQPEAAGEVEAPTSVAPAAPPGTAAREGPAPQNTFARAHAEPDQQQPGAVVRKAQRRGKPRTQSCAEQQENTEAGQVQQAGPADRRTPLIAMAGAALNQAGSSEFSSRGRKRHKGEAGGRAACAQGWIISQQATAGTGCPAELPVHGPARSAPRVLGLSSVPEAEARAAARAVKLLDGMRMCQQGVEESVTHLVLGSGRRTLKVLLGIAAGAWLLTPDWIAASAAAGKWLSEHSFQAETPFTEAAQRAREHAARGGQPLLYGKAVHIVKGTTADGNGSGAALARMAQAHGAKVTGLRQCDICVVCKGCTPPDRAKCPLAVSESWLLDLAATFKEPALSDAYDARKLTPA